MATEAPAGCEVTRLLVVDDLQPLGLNPWLCSGATFSPDKRHRYLLWRAWNHRPRVLWIMLNPSTADESVEDPTIRRCIGYARDWFFGGIWIANAFALRSTDPYALYATADQSYRIGPLNDWILEQLVAHQVEQGGPIVCAWGEHARKLYRDQRVLDIISRAGGQALCLHRTKGGAPGHPLYLRADAELREYP